MQCNKIFAKEIDIDQGPREDFFKLEIEKILQSVKVKNLVLDMSYTNMIDSTATQSLIEVISYLLIYLFIFPNV